MRVLVGMLSFPWNRHAFRQTLRFFFEKGRKEVFETWQHGRADGTYICSSLVCVPNLPTTCSPYVCLTNMDAYLPLSSSLPSSCREKRREPPDVWLCAWAIQPALCGCVCVLCVCDDDVCVMDDDLGESVGGW